MTSAAALFLIVLFSAGLAAGIRLHEGQRRRRAAYHRRIAEQLAERGASLAEAGYPHSHSATLTPGAQHDHA